MQTIITYFTLLFTGMMLHAQTSITVTITDLKSNDGTLHIGLYNSEGTFLNKTYQGAVEPIINNSATFTFTDVPAGEYAISTYHDENDNDTFDMRFGFIPKEEYVTSNYATGFFGPPSWEDAKFTLTEQPITINLKMNN